MEAYKVRGVLFFLLVLLLAGCGPTAPAGPGDGWISPLPRSAKGYELYSWRPPGQSQWHYVLITATNRLKTVEEITGSEDMITEAGWTRISVQGLDDLKDLLRRLPQGESVVWIDGSFLEVANGESQRIEMPGPEVIDEVRDYCRRFGVTLSVASWPVSDGPAPASARSD